MSVETRTIQKRMRIPGGAQVGLTWYRHTYGDGSRRHVIRPEIVFDLASRESATSHDNAPELHGTRTAPKGADVMYVVVLPNGNLLKIDFKTRWFVAEATRLAAEYGGTMRECRVGDPRS